MVYFWASFNCCEAFNIVLGINKSPQCGSLILSVIFALAEYACKLYLLSSMAANSRKLCLWTLLAANSVKFWRCRDMSRKNLFPQRPESLSWSEVYGKGTLATRKINITIFPLKLNDYIDFPNVWRSGSPTAHQKKNIHDHHLLRRWGSKAPHLCTRTPTLWMRIIPV